MESTEVQLQSLRQAVQVLELQQAGTKGMEFPIWAYLTCALAFEKLGETELYWSALETGYNELIQRADKISDAFWRKSYLENIPEHRSITILWKERSS